MQIPKYREQIRDMLDHSELREVVDSIENKKDNRKVNFTIKHPAARIYGKIGRMECQLVIDTRAEVSVCTKPMTDLLKLKPKPVLAFSNEVQSHVIEGHEEIEHMICHGSTEVQDVMCQQQSGDLKHMTELEALLADWLGEGSAEAQGSAETQGSAEA